MVGAAPGQAGDKEPEVCPITTLQVIDALGPSEWKGTLTLDATEGCAGILTFAGTIDGKAVEFSLEGKLRGFWTNLIAHALAGRTHGTATVEFYSIDAAGNPHVERIQVEVVSGDKPLVLECFDGVDNDGDGLIDYPHDPDCYSHTDDDES